MASQNKEPVNRTLYTAPSSSHQSTPYGNYSWYFQDDKNGWTKYGEGNAAFATNWVSDDIEKYYLENPTQPLHISNLHYNYVLDLVKLTQTNQTTNTVRNIIRTDANGTNFQNTMPSHSSADSEESFEWFFLNEKNQWIKFGETTSGDPGHATNLTSRDIEKHYQNRRTKHLYIENQYNKYVLDLVNMTQTNRTTKVVRN